MKTSIKKKRIEIPIIKGNEVFFFLSYFIFLTYMTLTNTFYLQYINKFWKPVFFGCLVLLFVHEIMSNEISLKSLFQLLGVFSVFVILLRIAGGYAQASVAWTILYLFCSRRMSFRTIAIYTGIISLALLIFIIGSAYSGIIRNYVFTGSGKRIRECLGFLYPLYASSLFSNITLLWIYCKKEKITVSGIVLFALGNYLLYQKTDSRLCFYLTILMLAIGIFLKYNKEHIKKCKFLCSLMILSFILTFLISFAVTINYNPSVRWMNQLNSMLGRRLALGQESLDEFGVRLFGIKGIQWTGNSLNMYGERSNETYLYVDNYYIQMMQRFGIFFLAVVLLFLTYAAYRSYKQNDIYLLLIFSLLAVHFMIDNLYMYLHYNTFWFAAGILVFSRYRTLVGKRSLQFINKYHHIFSE